MSKEFEKYIVLTAGFQEIGGIFKISKFILYTE